MIEENMNKRTVKKCIFIGALFVLSIFLLWKIILPFMATKKLLSVAHNMTVEEVINFIQNGADVNGVEKYGKTPLMLAARYNNAEVIQVLIENGADVNAITAKGNLRGWTSMSTG
jgi:hypothetical protein